MFLLLIICIKNFYFFPFFLGGGPPIDESTAKAVSAAVLDVMEAMEGSVGVAVEHTVIIMTDPAAPDFLVTATHLTRQVGQCQGRGAENFLLCSL